MRALEALDDVLNRREQVKNRVAQTRVKETEQEKASRRNNDKAHKTACRAKETEQERASSRKHLREHIAASPSHYITITSYTSKFSNSIH